MSRQGGKVSSASKTHAAAKRAGAPGSRPPVRLQSGIDGMLWLQSEIGNRVTSNAVASTLVQAKLRVGAPDDRFEREADRMADAVVRAPLAGPVAAPLIAVHGGNVFGQAQRSCAKCEAEELRRKPSQREAYAGQPEPVPEERDTIRRQVRSAPAMGPINGSMGPGPGRVPESAPAPTERAIRGARAGGLSLPAEVRGFMEPRFGHDFGDVRVHTDARAGETADQLGARAFTLGGDIFFAPGEFAPQTHEGRRLVAHELTHVVQQNSEARVASPTVQRAMSPKVAEIKDLLSYGLFDWRISDAEAVSALNILKSLPRIEQGEFLSDRKYAERLRSNLPADRVAELDPIEQDVASILPDDQVVNELIDKLSYGLFDWAITDKEAVSVLETLKTMSGEKLAITLTRIDYGRLMDNLPEDRRQELIDLLAAGLGTGGTKETSEETDPGVFLKGLSFLSDHGVMKDRTSGWDAGGSLYPEPQWTMNAGGKTESHPISQSKDSSVVLELAYDVLPGSAPSAPFVWTGESDVPYLQFSASGTASGGPDKSIVATSSGKLPDAVTAIKNKYITWKIKWRSWEHEVARSGPHSIFTTMSFPLAPSEVTYKRMELSTRLVGSSPNLDPHAIVSTIMSKWTRYNLDVERYANAWELADAMEIGAQCIDLVRFVQGIIGTVGVPGTAEAVVVFASPFAATKAIEQPWPHGGMSKTIIRDGKAVSAPRYSKPGEPSWVPVLLDGDLRPNNFEAALKFTHGSLAYYPGGVPDVLSGPDEVLRVFNCLAWVRSVSRDRYEIMEVAASYRGGCVEGAVHRWGG